MGDDCLQAIIADEMDPSTDRQHDRRQSCGIKTRSPACKPSPKKGPSRGAVCRLFWLALDHTLEVVELCPGLTPEDFSQRGSTSVVSKKNPEPRESASATGEFVSSRLPAPKKIKSTNKF